MNLVLGIDLDPIWGCDTFGYKKAFLCNKSTIKAFVNIIP